MGLISRALGSGGEKRFMPLGESLPRWSSESVGDQPYDRGGPMSIVTFFTCVSILADAVSSLQIKAYRPAENGVSVPVKSQPPLLQKDPYPGITWQQCLWMLMESLCVTGNGYLWVASRDERGYPTALMPVHPRLVTVERASVDVEDWADPRYFINGHYVPSNDMVHIKRYPVANEILGLSPVQHMQNSINLTLEVERYGLQWFRDSSMPSGVLHSEQDLTPTQVKQTLKMWMLSHRQRRTPAVVGSGMKWTPLTVPPDESQFLATREYQRSEIGMLFRIPPHMLGDSTKATSWGSGIASMDIGFLKYTVEPWLNCIEAELRRLLPGTQEAKFDISGIMRGDPETRWKTYQLGFDMGVFSPNDIRKMEDLEPLGPEGDTRYHSIQHVPLGTPISDYLGSKSGDATDSGNDPQPQEGN